VDLYATQPLGISGLNDLKKVSAREGGNLERRLQTERRLLAAESTRPGAG